MKPHTTETLGMTQCPSCGGWEFVDVWHRGDCLIVYIDHPAGRSWHNAYPPDADPHIYHDDWAPMMRQECRPEAP